MFDEKREYNMKLIFALVFIVVPILLSVFSAKYFNRKVAISRYEKMVKEYPIDSYKGKSFVTASYPLLIDCVLAGDSYAHFVAYDLGFDMTNYSCPGLTLEYLRQVFDGVLQNNKKYVVIFIGPNDFSAKTPLTKFRKILNGYINEINEKMNAKVLLCTYLPSEFTHVREKIGECVATIPEYNDVILDLVSENDFVYYLDLSKFADKKEYYKASEGYDDDIHLSKKFNIEFINELYKKLLSIEKDMAYNG